MGKVQVVKKGEHVPRIAAAEGFGDFTIIWDDPDNAELKERRTNPCILNPGDELVIPDKRPKEVKLATGAEHAFVVTRPQIRLRLALQDASRRPLANLQCKLRCGGATFELTLDGDGQLDQPIPIDSEACKLTLPEGELSLLVGHLPPLDEPTGLRARLDNLGYHAGPPDEGTDDDQEDEQKESDLLLRSALEEFQCDNGLKVTGDPDDPTRAKLLEIYGT